MKHKDTYIIDLDGVLCRHEPDHLHGTELIVFTEARFTVNRLAREGHYIVIMTGRREVHRAFIEDKLAEQEVIFDQVVCGVKPGRRILINDRKPYEPDEPTAIAINLRRNDGLNEGDLECVSL